MKTTYPRKSLKVQKIQLLLRYSKFSALDIRHWGIPKNLEIPKQVNQQSPILNSRRRKKKYKAKVRNTTKQIVEESYPIKTLSKRKFNSIQIIVLVYNKHC